MHPIKAIPIDIGVKYLSFSGICTDLKHAIQQITRFSADLLLQSFTVFSDHLKQVEPQAYILCFIYGVDSFYYQNVRIA